MYINSSKRFMIVDNNLMSLMLFKKLFGQYFEAVDTENSYSEMIARLVSGHKPDIILADLDLSRVSGLDLLKAIKQNKALQHIPVILMSVCFTERVVAFAMQAGASACINKPLSTMDYTAFCENVISLIGEESKENVLKAS